MRMSLTQVSEKKDIKRQNKVKYLVIEHDPDSYGDDKPHPYILSGNQVRVSYFGRFNPISAKGTIYIYEIKTFSNGRRR